MRATIFGRLTLIVVACGPLFLSSCKETTDGVAPVASSTGVATTSEVNDWILSNMKYSYFWTDRIPANTDKTLTPDQYFLSLLYDRNNSANADRDRFSWIQQSAAELKASLSGQTKTTGMEYKLYFRDNTQTSIVASIIYVLPGSPAAVAGIKRGDIISKVNGQSLTGTNYQGLLQSNADSYTFGFASIVNGTLTDDPQSKSVTALVFQQDPVLLDSTYTIGGKTIGYVVYNQFIPGALKADGTLGNTYDLKLDNIFGKFKQKGVNELILDLRYNRGGYVSSATNLASLIGRNIDASKIFYDQKWNSTVTAAYNKEYGAGWNIKNFVSKATNIGGNLSRVYVLTTNSTASASELIINGLRPFMTVNTIGTTTVGKNVGSITLSDDSGKIKWGMQPITFKSANALGFTDYAGGFTPTVEVKEPNYGMKAFGDVTEVMLSEAIFQISGTRMARRAASSEVIRPSVFSSIDSKAGGGNMFVDAIPSR